MNYYFIGLFACVAVLGIAAALEGAFHDPRAQQIEACQHSCGFSGVESVSFDTSGNISCVCQH